MNNTRYKNFQDEPAVQLQGFKNMAKKDQYIAQFMTDSLIRNPNKGKAVIPS